MNGPAFARRDFLGGAAALLPAGIATQSRALGPGGLNLNFTEVGGSTDNRGDKNRRAFLNAISRLDRAGGGTLSIPPGDYAFAGDASAVARNITVLGYGATFRGADCRITMQTGSYSYNIQGLALVETSGSKSSFLLNCAGTNCHIKDVHLQKDPPAGGYIAYCQQQTSGYLFENVSFSGSNGIYLGGHDHEVRGGWAESSGGDDCWVLKAHTFPCYNIRISGFRARGFAALFSIGSEIGTYQVDNPSRNLFVKNVVVENCAADACTLFAYIKPGGVEVSDYRDGVVEDVTISNCSIRDAVGTRFRNGIYVSPGRGAIVRRLSVQNFSVEARGASPPMQTVGAIHLMTYKTVNGAGEGARIEDVSVTGLRCVDPYGGVAPSTATPGEPIHVPIAIEKRDPLVGAIGRVEFRDGYTDGCARMAAGVSSGIDGPVWISDFQFLNFAAAIKATIDKQAILANSPVELQNVVATPSPYAPPGTPSIP